MYYKRVVQHYTTAASSNQPHLNRVILSGNKAINNTAEEDLDQSDDEDVGGMARVVLIAQLRKSCSTMGYMIADDDKERGRSPTIKPRAEVAGYIDEPEANIASEWTFTVPQGSQKPEFNILNRSLPAVTEIKGVVKDKKHKNSITRSYSRKRSTSSTSREDPDIARLRHMVERMEVPLRSILSGRDDKIDRLRRRFEADEQRERRRRAAGVGYDTGYGDL